MLRPKALEHVGLIVTDMNRSLIFYQRLGFEFVRGPRRPGGATVLKAGNTEINAFCNPDSTSDSTRQRVDHLCLDMDYATMDELIEALAAAGIAIASGPVKRSDGTALFVHDPDGMRIELLVKHPL